MESALDNFVVGVSVTSPEGLQTNLIKLLGKGQFGKVFQGQCGGMKLAVKVVETKNPDEREFVKETEIAALRFFSKSKVTPQLMWDNAAGECHIIAIELLGQSLASLIEGNTRLMPADLVRQYGLQIAQALDFLHKKQWIHGDIKPGNICLDYKNKMKVKLTDLGGAVPLQKLLNETKPRQIGTRAYNSPEALLGLPLNTTLDVWSLGCVMAELLNGQCLFQVKTDAELYKMFEKWDLLPAVPDMGHFYKAVTADLDKVELPDDLPASFEEHLMAAQPDDFSPAGKERAVKHLKAIFNPNRNYRLSAAKVAEFLAIVPPPADSERC